MSVLDSDSTTLAIIIEDSGFDEAQVAAAAFLARYNGRTLDAYRYDLRTFFQWASDVDLAVLEAKRTHTELYRTAMEQKGLAPSRIDRRLSTVCGFYRFAHIDGRVSANPAHTSAGPRSTLPRGGDLDRREFGTFLFTAERFDRDHAALAVLLGLNGLRVSEACGTNIEDLAFTQGHRTLRIMGKGSKPAVNSSSQGLHGPLTGPSVKGRRARPCEGRTEKGWTGGPPTAGCVRSASKRGSTPSTPTCSGQRSSWPPSMPGSPL